MWLQMRSWNVFSLLNGTSWKIFCLLLSPESPWGHPSRRAPAHQDSLRKKFLTCQPPVLHGREGCLELLGIGSWLCQDKAGVRPHKPVCEGRSMSSPWLGQPCRVLSQSPLAVQLLEMSQAMAAAKGGSLSWEPKCLSGCVSPPMPQMVCYPQIHFQTRLFLRASLMESWCSKNTCTTSSSGSVWCTTCFQKQKCWVKVPEGRKTIVFPLH